MNYCSNCGSSVDLVVPDGDNRPRHVCDSCGAIHYLNPKIVTGCIPEWDGRVLLCRRAIAPRYGFWTLPAGFMENGESTQDGAAREAMEEANARVEVRQLFTTFNLPHLDQVYIMFRGALRDLDFSPGEESLEVALFDERQVPWDQLAFPVIAETLRLYFADRDRGRFFHRTGDIVWVSKPERRYRVKLLGDPENGC